MATGLTNQAANAFRGDDEVDRILGLPITQMRLELKHAYQDKKFDEAQFNSFLERLSKVDNLGGQVDIAKKAVAAGAVENELDIELNAPAKQLLWAAVFTRMMQTRTEKKEGPLARSTLWNQMQGTLGFHNEEIGVAQVISRSLQNAETVFEWGQPGSWFYYQPKTNKINLDMYYTLLMGFEHTRAVTLHEIGHSELSNTYSKRMKELYEKVKVLIDPSTIIRDEKDKSKRPRIKMKKAEYRQLMLDVAEWQLRFKLWHMTEDNAVNQFSSNMRHLLTQHFGISLNYVSAVLQGFGEIVNGDAETRDVRISTNKPPDDGTPEREVWEEKQKEKQDKANAKRDAFIARQKTPLTDDEVKEIKAGNISKDVAVKMFDQMTTAVLLAFYEQNGLFSGSDKSWERLRIIPDDIRRAVDVSGIPGAAGADAFEYLVNLSVGQLKPDTVLIKLPLERARALRYLDEMAVDEELLKVPADRKAALEYLLERDFGKTVKKTFASLSSSLGAQTQKRTPIEIQEAMAREILALPRVLGAEKAALVEDPVEELFRQQARIPELRVQAARDLLARTGVIGPDAAALVEDPIEEVFQQAARAHGIRNLQPQPSDRLLVHEPHKTVGDSYRAAVAFTSEQRGKLMEHIWDTYMAPYAAVILKEHEKKLDKKKDKKNDKQDDKNQQKGKPQQGQGGGGGGEGDDDQNNGGDSSPDIDDDDNDDNEGGKQDSGIDIEDEDDPEGGKGEGDDNDEVELDEDDLKDIGDLSKDPGEGRDNENSPGQGKKGDKPDKPDDKNDKKDGDGSGWDKDDKPPEQRKNKKVGDLKDQKAANENLTPEEKEALKKAAAEREGKEQAPVQIDDKGPSTNFDVSEYAKGSWLDFYARLRELMPVIMHREAIYRKVLDEQRQALRKQSVERFSLLPVDGDFRGRLDKSRVLEKKFKEITHQPRKLDDLKQIRDDDIHYVDSSVDSISLIDGSGSMKMVGLGNGVTAMDVALQSALIDYMAARRAGLGSWLIMWGNEKPYVIATPTTPLEEVGKRLEGVRDGLNSSTNLAPALGTALQELGDFVNKRTGVSGTSLLTIYSDGEIQDFVKAAKQLTILTKNAKNLSIEVAVLVEKGTRPEAKTKMEEVFDEVIKESGNRFVSVMRGDDARVVPLELGRRALQRLRKFKVQLEPDKKKRARFKKISRELKDNKT